MDVGRHEGAAGLAGRGTGVGEAALGEGGFADEVGQGVLVVGYVWGAAAVDAGARVLEGGLERGFLLAHVAGTWCDPTTDWRLDGGPLVMVMRQVGTEPWVGLTPTHELALVCDCPPHSVGQLAVSP